MSRAEYIAQTAACILAARLGAGGLLGAGMRDSFIRESIAAATELADALGMVADLPEKGLASPPKREELCPRCHSRHLVRDGSTGELWLDCQDLPIGTWAIWPSPNPEAAR